MGAPVDSLRFLKALSVPQPLLIVSHRTVSGAALFLLPSVVAVSNLGSLIAVQFGNIPWMEASFLESLIKSVYPSDSLNPAAFQNSCHLPAWALWSVAQLFDESGTTCACQHRLLTSEGEKHKKRGVHVSAVYVGLNI